MPPSPVVRGSSSQRALRNAARKCSVCGVSLGTAGARGMCYRHYREATVKEKANPLESRIPSAREDPDVVVPRRKRFEWLGSLSESISAIAQEE